MRRRTAIKIQRAIEEHQRLGNWKRTTVWKSRTICRRYSNDRRVPYIPTDEELEERMGFLYTFLADVLVDDPDEREKIKEQIWRAIDGDGPVDEGIKAGSPGEWGSESGTQPSADPIDSKVESGGSTPIS